MVAAPSAWGCPVPVAQLPRPAFRSVYLQLSVHAQPSSVCRQLPSAPAFLVNDSVAFSHLTALYPRVSTVTASPASTSRTRSQKCQLSLCLQKSAPGAQDAMLILLGGGWVSLAPFASTVDTPPCLRAPPAAGPSAAALPCCNGWFSAASAVWLHNSLV